MNTLDLILGVALGYGFFRGLFKGFVQEIAGFLAVGLGVYGAIHFSFYVAEYLKTAFSWDKQTLQVVAFVITLLGIMLLVGFLGRILTNLLETATLGAVNRFFGGILGLLKWTLITGSILLTLSKRQLPILPSELTSQSVLYEPVRQVSAFIYAKYIQEFTKLE